MQWYTLCFLKQGTKVLLLNRQKNPWMGRWTGVGGKIEVGEAPLNSAIREIKEETTIDVSELFYGGQLLWTVDHEITGGLHLFLTELPEKEYFSTPIATREGILDFKEIDWILDSKNQGMPDNIPFVLKDLLLNPQENRYMCYFENNQFLKVEKQ
ncbi:NUDIX hydrolase [Carnobacterium divergens]|uniref:NUDIX hydrolase n=1 Tax=Carnobacterium divergens TaxID=2748 RepID=UPI00128CDF14|nr:8-oxo-dGTP diphosphatase [Carnobacterium divergens]MPQ21225.1 8-oxo-dGTP diphosphatase [Carnobacterium divergens]